MFLFIFVLYKIDYINLCLIKNNFFKIVNNVYNFSNFKPKQILIK
jgi:hypothetical protein